MKILLWKVLGYVALMAAVLYVFDFISAKYAIPANRQVYADVTITRYWAIKEKGNKIEYAPADPVIERCVYAIFPHFGYRPCWYVMRHTRRAIEVGALRQPVAAEPPGGCYARSGHQQTLHWHAVSMAVRWMCSGVEPRESLLTGFARPCDVSMADLTSAAGPARSVYARPTNKADVPATYKS